MTINSPFGIEIAIRIYSGNNPCYNWPYPCEWVNFHWISIGIINIELFSEHKHHN